MNRNLEAYCGLYCGACPVYLHRENDWIVKTVLNQQGLTIDELHCEGCRSDILSPSCQDCKTRDCAVQRGLDSCSACEQLPCDRILVFGSDRPHGLEVMGNLIALHDHGSEVWLDREAVRWACTRCGRAGSWYESVCPQCGEGLPSGHQPTSP